MPPASITLADDMRRARAVTTVLLVTLAISALLILIEAGSTALVNARLIVTAAMLIAYVVSRTGRFRLAGMIGILALFASPVLALLFGTSDIELWHGFAVRSFGAGILLVYVIFSWRMLIIFLALIFIEIFLVAPLALPNYLPSFLLRDMIFSFIALFYTLIISREFHYSERRTAEEEMQASEARYRAIVEDQNELICRWLPESRVLTFVNGAYRRYFGSEDDLVGSDFITDVYSEDAQTVAESVASIRYDNPTVIYEHRITRQDGSIRWMQWRDHGIFDSANKLIEVQSVGRDITENREAQDELRASEARYRAIVEDQTELICRWLPDETTTFANAAYARFANTALDDLIGTSVMSMIYEEDLPMVRRMVERLSLQEPTVTYEHRVLQPDGSFRWYQWTDRAFFDAQGGIVEYQSVGRDVTDLKNAEESEREQRLFAEALRANAAVISSTLDLEEVLDHILQHIKQAYPFVSADIMLVEDGIARVMRSTGGPDDAYAITIRSLRLRASEFPNMKYMIQTGQPVLIGDTHTSPMWTVLPISSWIRSSVSAPIRLQGMTLGFLILNSDKPDFFSERHTLRLRAFADQAATAIGNARLYDAERRHADAMEKKVLTRTSELELATRRLSVIFESTGEGIFYTEDEVIQFVNPTFCKMIGCAPDQLIGKNINDLYSPNNDPERLAALAQHAEIIHEVGIWRGEVLMRRADETDFDAGLTISPIGSTDETPTRAVIIVRDISQEKALQAQRSNLLAFASHELRTPITNLKTRLYLLRRRPETLPEHLSILDTVARRMQYLVENLLDMSRLERGKVEIERAPFDVREIMEEIVLVQRPEADRKDLVLLVELPSEPLVIDGDRQRMVQVITNLVSNAINYTPAGGSITVGAKRTGPVALLFVSDTGIGIAPDNLQHIFEPFFRVASKIDGTGLGLSIVKEIVHLHQGEISVQSEIGKGSRFIVRLPLYAEPMTEQVL